MQTGIAAAVAAMDLAVRRLDAALAQRAGVVRRLTEQHGQMAAEVKSLRDELQAARDEATNLRERAALVDALRAELGQIQQDSLEQVGGHAPGGEDQSAAHAAALAARDAEIAALRGQLAAAQDSQKPTPAFIPPPSDSTGDVAALKAELAAARATQTEMQAFQSGIAARLEATMARLRQALDSQVKV